MSFKKETKQEILEYCSNHLATDEWYENEFSFIKEQNIKSRLVSEFKAIRFAYKLYEGIEADLENLLFEIKTQILSYATIYEAVIHYILYTYYADTLEFEKLTNHVIPIKISIPQEKLIKLKSELEHDGKEIVTFYYTRKPKEEAQIRFDAKCNTAEELGLIHSFSDKKGEKIDLVKEIIEIYSYRNGIHIIAEQRKGIQYELELSKKAYRRMRPFIYQIKNKLKMDNKL